MNVGVHSLLLVELLLLFATQFKLVSKWTTGTTPPSWSSDYCISNLLWTLLRENLSIRTVQNLFMNHCLPKYLKLVQVTRHSILSRSLSSTLPSASFKLLQPPTSELPSIGSRLLSTSPLLKPYPSISPKDHLKLKQTQTQWVDTISIFNSFRKHLHILV